MYCIVHINTAASVDGCRREALPDDCLADVRSDEQRDAAAETVALLKELVEQENDDASDEELEHDGRAYEQAHLTRIAVHSRHYVHDRLPKSDHHAEHCV